MIYSPCYARPSSTLILLVVFRNPTFWFLLLLIRDTMMTFASDIHHKGPQSFKIGVGCVKEKTNIPLGT